MEIPIEMPLDNGYLRRECPHCEREFKWHHGPTDDAPPDAPNPGRYTCPYCGEKADHDQWFTQAQAEHIRESAAGPAMQMISDELGRHSAAHAASSTPPTGTWETTHPYRSKNEPTW